MSLAVGNKPCASAVIGAVGLLSSVRTALRSLGRPGAAERSAPTGIALSLIALLQAALR